jgi:hypothetical protein
MLQSLDSLAVRLGTGLSALPRIDLRDFELPDLGPVSEQLAALADQAAVEAREYGQGDRSAEREAQAKLDRQKAKELARLKVSKESQLETALYNKGTRALDAGRWSQAVEAFASAIAQKGPRADGALYWKAYAEFKLAQRAAALATLQALKSGYPSSGWLKEAQALEVEMSGAAAATTGSAGEDDELKLLAINGLLRADASDERALPVLEKILKSQQTPQVKKRALFVLSQNQTPRSRDIMMNVARGSSNPDLQLEALRFIGMSGNKGDLQLLADTYTSSKDSDVRRVILETYMMTGQVELVARAAKAEPDERLRRQAIHLLGAMHASAELDRLYQGENSEFVRQAIVEAFMASGDGDRLVQIAKSDKDQAMRVRAVEMLGALGKGQQTAFMLGIYGTAGQSRELKLAVVNALFIAGESKTLVDLARKESEQPLRKAIVERLSVMNSKEATDYLMELINK